MLTKSLIAEAFMHCYYDPVELSDIDILSQNSLTPS